MRSDSSSGTSSTRSHSPRAFTVFAAAFVAGAAAAVGVNSVLDVRLAQAKPRVESEPIFVALRSLPQGAAVTVWDVALREWPRAMVPTSALRSSDSFSGLVLKHPLREGQPLLSIQLVETEATVSNPLSVTAVSTPRTSVAAMPETDLWAPAEPTPPAVPTALPAAEQGHQDTPQQQAVQPRPQADGQAGIRGDQPPSSSPESAATAAALQPSVATVPPTVAAAMPVEAAPPAADAVVPPSADAGLAVAAATPMPAAMPAAEAFTDESLDALVATTPAAESVVAPPPADVIAPPSAAVASAPREAASPGPAATAESLAQEAAADADAFATQPAATPTLADPPATPLPGEAAAGAEAVPASVMRQPTADDRAPPPQPVAPRVATRYLVVPESIALRADASFAAPRQPDQPAAAETVKPLPSTAAQPGRGQPAGQPVQQRASQPRRGTSAAVPTPGQRPTAAQAAAPQPRRSMFPNIAAGIETLDGEMARIRRERAGQPPATTPRPQY